MKSGNRQQNRYARTAKRYFELDLLGLNRWTRWETCPAIKQKGFEPELGDSRELKPFFNGINRDKKNFHKDSEKRGKKKR